MSCRQKTDILVVEATLEFAQGWRENVSCAGEGGESEGQTRGVEGRGGGGDEA